MHSKETVGQIDASIRTSAAFLVTSGSKQHRKILFVKVPIMTHNTARHPLLPAPRLTSD